MLIGIDTGVRMIYASCCAPLHKKDAPLKKIMYICLEIVEESNLLASMVMIPDARQGNRWCLCVNLASPTSGKPKKYQGGRKEVLWALLMGVVHSKEGFFSLSRYRDAPNWTYGEVTKRLK